MPTAADGAIQFALSQVGKPYVFGSGRPITGQPQASYDCSSLTGNAYMSVGIDIGGDTFVQVTKGTAVAQKDLAPGDLVFPDPGHVQIFLGNGNIVEAPHTGANVRVVPMWGYWQARRVAAPGQAAGGPTGATTTVGLTGVPGLDTLLAPIEAMSKIAAFFADPTNWKRLALFVGGMILMVMATIDFSHVTRAAKAIKNVGM